jgi:hypothetical protein
MTMRASVVADAAYRYDLRNTARWVWLLELPPAV